MSEKVTAEQAKLNLATSKIKEAFAIFAEADGLLREIGVDVNSVTYCSFYQSVLLSRGINNLSIVSGVEIASDQPFKGYGQTMVDGVDFHQEMMPVERIARYA